jgi:hypothetical protein
MSCVENAAATERSKNLSRREVDSAKLFSSRRVSRKLCSNDPSVAAINRGWVEPRLEPGVVFGDQNKWFARDLAGVMVAISLLLAMTQEAFSKNDGCVLSPDDRNPPEKILRCGDDLVVRTAQGTRYRPIVEQGQERPKALLLDAGALMIEFHPSEAVKNFQILTPFAIAAVRGTKWIVEAHPRQTSTFVIFGEVEVSRRYAEGSVILAQGQGADVSLGVGPITAKNWPPRRVSALLARFGE